MRGKAALWLRRALGVGLLLVTKAKATPIVTVVICGVLGGVVYTLFPVLATI